MHDSTIDEQRDGRKDVKPGNEAAFENRHVRTNEFLNILLGMLNKFRFDTAMNQHII
jgi:hypothetical protein